eukprot:bmy_03847T0
MADRPPPTPALTLPGTTQGGRDFWRSYNMADIDNKEQSELGQGLDDFEEVEEETGEETKIKAPQLTVQMMQNPQILAALPERPDGLVETPTGYIESLPRVVKRRVNALKNLQPDEEDEISEKLKEKAKIEDEKKDKEKEDPKGIPEFWLTVFKNGDLLSDMYLKDIKVKFSDVGQPMSFVLEFHFEPNEYFTNEVLIKTYRMRSESDDSDPFSFDGPEIMGCTGCQIDRKKGKNVILKTIKKQQKHKGRATVRTVTKTVSNDSSIFLLLLKFLRVEIWMLLLKLSLLHSLKLVTFYCIILKSVLYFTGEAIEDDDDDEEGEVDE